MKRSIKYLVYPLAAIVISLFVIVGCSDDDTEPKFNLILEVYPEDTGIANGTGQYQFGEKANISAVPGVEWRFVNWTGNINYIDDPTSASSHVIMPDYDISLTANFIEKYVYGEGVTDIDGNEYTTVVIGNQEWVAENLRVTKYSNGDVIPKVMAGFQWIMLTSGAYSYEDSNMLEAYGAIYNWYAAASSKGLCPEGWRVPTENDWVKLVDYLVSQGFPNDDSDDPIGAGNVLKSCLQVDSPFGVGCETIYHPRWDSDDTHHGFNEFGFSALPGGFRLLPPSTEFHGVGRVGIWWTSTQVGANNAYSYNISSGNIRRGNRPKIGGVSVRCVRDLD